MTNNFKPQKGGYKKPQLSPEEYKEKKQAEKDAVYQMIDDTATTEIYTLSLHDALPIYNRFHLLEHHKQELQRRNRQKPTKMYSPFWVWSC